MRSRDVFAGALLSNAIPHAVIGLAGKRCMTPLGGTNSTAGTNLAWASCNVLAATAALNLRSWRQIDQSEADQRLLSVTLGMMGAAALAAMYELTPAAAHNRRLRAEAADFSQNPTPD